MANTNPEDIPAVDFPCAHCQATVRCPETLLGKQVRCPDCKKVFFAPTRQKNGELTAPKTPEQMGLTRIGFDNSPALVAGLLLLLMGIGYIIVNGAFVYQTTINSENFIAKVKEGLANPENELRKLLEKSGGFNVEDFGDENLKTIRMMSIIGLMGGLTVTIGAFSVLFRRYYQLAIIACITSIVNFNFLCCILGAPIGIYGLVKLFDPDVRKLFKS